jgi:3-phenylpropionate/trans-cinnamate dioxygenase ferredoxin reductase component
VSATPGLVIVGGCYAGFNVAASARASGYSDAITVLSDEGELPYQRPPLSKGFLLDTVAEGALPLRASQFYRDHAVEVLLNHRASSIDRAGKRVVTDSGLEVPYSTLVLTVGARARALNVAGCELDGVVSLRSLADARALRERIDTVRTAVVIGGGFIGLEVAAVLASSMKHVTVIEAQDRLLARSATARLSSYVAGLHRSKGVGLKLGVLPEQILGVDGRVRSVRCDDGAVVPADIVIVAVGIVPNVEIAKAAGLPCNNGIVVDRFTRTADEAILAAGDCTCHPNPFAGAIIRLESVQNAVDQAKVAGACVAGHSRPYEGVPWFWSDQFDCKLQMSGLATGSDTHAVRGSLEEGRFSLYHFRSGQLVAVESANHPADQIVARKLIAGKVPVTPEQVSDPSVDLAALLRVSVRGA